MPLKEYGRIAKRHEWVVVRRDWTARFGEEDDFATVIAGYRWEVVEALSAKARINSRVAAADGRLRCVSVAGSRPVRRWPPEPRRCPVQERHGGAPAHPVWRKSATGVSARIFRSSASDQWAM